VKAH
jgi:hypothetical protein